MASCKNWEMKDERRCQQMAKACQPLTSVIMANTHPKFLIALEKSVFRATMMLSFVRQS